MKIKPFILKSPFCSFNSKLLNISKIYRDMVELRHQEKKKERPIDLLFEIKKVSIFFIYNFENYKFVHDKLDKFFNIKFHENNFAGYIYSNIGSITPENFSKNIGLFNPKKLKNFPKNIEYICCSIHKILPSTSVLVFDIYLTENFTKDIYHDFYCEDDVIVFSSDMFLKNVKFDKKSSKKKLNERLINNNENIRNWLIRSLSFEKNQFKDITFLNQINLKNISERKSSIELIRRNENFLTSNFLDFNEYLYFNSENLYYIEDISNILFLTFQKDALNSQFDNLTRSLILIKIINIYQKDLKEIKEKLSDKTTTNDIQYLTKKVIDCNNLNFQVARLFKEIKRNKVDKLPKRVKKESFKNLIGFTFSEYLENFVELNSDLLPDNFLLIKNLTDKELDSINIRTNFDLQLNFRKLTKAAIFLSIVSLTGSFLSYDWSDIQKNAEKFRSILQDK